VPSVFGHKIAYHSPLGPPPSSACLKCVSRLICFS